MKNGVRHACIPPSRTFKCERVAAAMKMRVQTEEEIRSQRHVQWEKTVRVA